jgi:acyl-CoA thioester hydrolase
LLRAAGFEYRRLEELGFMLVVHEIHCVYHQPAAFDDVLRLRTTTVAARGARVEHRYEVFRDDLLLAEGRSVVACINRAGRVTRLPDFLLSHVGDATDMDMTKVDDS